MVCANCHGEIHAGIRKCPDIDHEKRRESLEKIMAEKPIAKRDQRQPCAACGKPVPKTKKFCNRICTYKSQERIKWPENLKELVKASSALAVAKTLGVTDKAVAKRIASGR